KNLVYDTLSFPLAGAPRAVKVSFGEYFPGFISDRRPDTYDLYLLTKAENEYGRREALQNLFETSNANLFSTTLGIAMDDRDPSIRMEALRHAGNLPLPAQLKLENTLRKLATEDPDARIRAEAE